MRVSLPRLSLFAFLSLREGEKLRAGVGRVDLKTQFLQAARHALRLTEIMFGQVR